MKPVLALTQTDFPIMVVHFALGNMCVEAIMKTTESSAIFFSLKAMLQSESLTSFFS
jgi:hypothetical protein